MDSIRIDDLQCRGLKLKQDRNLFCFGTDAVLLYHFADFAGCSKVADFGCASGIISVLAAGNHPGTEVYGVEIQDALYDLAEQNRQLNGLENLHFVHGDIKDAKSSVGLCDAVLCNPPYEKTGSGILPKNECHRIARYECLITFDETAQAASSVLEDGGKFYFIHRSYRFDELCETLRRHSLGVKTVRFVHPYAESKSELVLVSAVKGARYGISVLAPLVIHNADGSYTSEVKEMYGSEK